MKVKAEETRWQNYDEKNIKQKAVKNKSQGKKGRETRVTIKKESKKTENSGEEKKEDKPERKEMQGEQKQEMGMMG